MKVNKVNFVRIYSYVDAFGHSVRQGVEVFYARNVVEAVSLTAKDLFGSVELSEIVSGRVYARCNRIDPMYFRNPTCKIGDALDEGTPERVQMEAVQTYAPTQIENVDWGWIS